MNKIAGKQTILFPDGVYIKNSASIVGKKEGEGPLKKYFDKIATDDMFGGTSWEEAESMLQSQTVNLLLNKASMCNSDIRYAFAGDLLGQLMATSFGLKDFDIPLFGLYGACSTFAEAVALGSMVVSGGFSDDILAMASSHFASAEKTFRFPLGYGCQRKFCSTYTVTGCGAVIISSGKSHIRVAGATIGKIVDYGYKDKENMGGCMAPAAADTIYNNLTDLGIEPSYYDKIITGDLGYVGQTILLDILKTKGIDISGIHTDCGMEMFNMNSQDTNAGGSGCGCAASVFCSYIIHNLQKNIWKRILFVPTGALLSPTSSNEGNSIPGIAHGIIVEAV